MRISLELIKDSEQCNCSDSNYTEGDITFIIDNEEKYIRIILDNRELQVRSDEFMQMLNCLKG